MNVAEYYKFQAVARNLNTLHDLEGLTRLKHRLYDRVISEWLPRDKDAVFYEAACGPGIFLSWLNSRGYQHISGSDSSEEQIALAQKTHSFAKIADSLAELSNQSPNSLDCVIGLDFYEHLPKPVMLDFFSIAYTALKPGGILILRGPNGDSPVIGRSLFNDITHHWALTSVAFRAILQMTGFQEVTFKDDALASIERFRIVKVPLSWLAIKFLKFLLRAATREQIPCLSASFFVMARK